LQQFPTIFGKAAKRPETGGAREYYESNREGTRIRQDVSTMVRKKDKEPPPQPKPAPAPAPTPVGWKFSDWAAI
jgi:hypothetical protein